LGSHRIPESEEARSLQGAQERSARREERLSVFLRSQTPTG
jgi:hypothetical protein